MKTLISLLPIIALISCQQHELPTPKHYIDMQYNGNTIYYGDPVVSSNQELLFGTAVYLRSTLFQDDFSLVLGSIFPKHFNIYDVYSVYSGEVPVSIEQPEGEWGFQLLPAYPDFEYIMDDYFGSVEFVSKDQVKGNCFNATIKFTHFSYKKEFTECLYPKEICVNEFTGKARFKICLN